MGPLLLVLVLFSDPSGEAAAKAVGEELGRLGGASVQVVVGPDAVAQLETRGVQERDLVISPAIASHLTESEPKLVVVRLERRASGGDEVVESRIWSLGKSENHVAIAGRGGDPLAGAITGIIQVIGPRLPTQPGAAPSNEDAEMAQLAQAREWQPLIERLVAKQAKDPRQFYYLVLAYSRLGQPDAARDALAAMRTAHAAHFLVRAAESLVPASAKPISDTPPPPRVAPKGDDGGNTLRDVPPTVDDGTNVLK